MFGLTSPGNLTRPRGSQHDELEHRQHAELAARHAQPHASAVRSCRSTTPGRSGAPRRRSRSAPTPTSIRRARCSARRTFPAPRRRTSPTPARCTGLLTGRITAINGTARLGRGQQSVRVSRSAHRTRAHERDRTLRPGLVALHADAHAQLRRALGTAAADAAAQRLILDVGASRTSAAARASATGPAGAAATCSSPERLPGSTPQYVQYDSGNPGYDTDWNNFAPNVGVAWRPNVQDGWLRTLLGDPDQATIRAGYSVAFTRERMDRFTNLYSANPGAAINANRTGNQGNLVLPGESWPITLSQPSRLGPPLVPGQPRVSADAVARQRRRHQHLRSGHQGAEHPLLEHRPAARDLERHGDRRPLRRHAADERLDDRELERDQRLRERVPGRVQAGAGQPARARRRRLRHGCRGACSFAYRGPGTGTSPLPTYLAYFAGLPASRAGDPSAYSGRDAVHEQRLDRPPRRVRARSASTPATICTPTRRCAPTRWPRACAANFFVLNPDVDQANITRDAASTKYDALQIDFRRRLVARPDGLNQLHLRQDLRDRSRHAAPRSRLHPGRRRRAACVQDDVVLRAAGRARQAVRRRHQSVAERPDRQLGVLRHGPSAGPRLPDRRSRRGSSG